MSTLRDHAAKPVALTTGSAGDDDSDRSKERTRHEAGTGKQRQLEGEEQDGKVQQTITMSTNAPIEDDVNFAAEDIPPQEDEEQDEPEQEGEVPYPGDDEAERENLLPPADFKPFFTLVSSSSSGSDEHHHPTVHYVFSDDDPHILTDAALLSLQLPSSREQNMEEERFVIVDLAPDGKEVVNTVSLSTEWQVTRTKVGPAPSWDGGEGEGRGLMIVVEGREGGKRKGKGHVQGDVETLVKELDEGMAGLDGILGRDEK